MTQAAPTELGEELWPEFYRLQENVVQVFQPALSRFGAGFVATKGFLATPRAGWKTCATFLFLEVYINIPPRWGEKQEPSLKSKIAQLQKFG